MSKAEYTKMEGKDEGASLTSTVINTVKAIMGAGILTLSWAFYFSSMWPGVICALFMCLLSAYGFYLVGICSDKTGGESFGGMWSALYDSALAWIPDMVIVLFCSCCIISYLIVCSDYLPRGLGGFGVPAMDRSVYILGASLVVLPLNFMEDLSVLTYTSFIGNFSVFYTTGLLLVMWLSVSPSDYGDWDPWVVQPGLFVTLPTMAFSFNGHFGAPKMYQQLSGKSPAKWLKVTILGFGLCLPLVLICALSGYFMFGTDVMLPGRSNVLMAPMMKGPPVLVAFIGMTLAVLFGVPIHTNTVRTAINGIYVRAKGIDPSADGSARKSMITIIIIVFTNAVALSMDSLGLTVAVNGAVCATLMMYVLPALMYMKAVGSSALPMATLILGVIIGVVGVATSILVGMDMTSDLRW